MPGIVASREFRVPLLVMGSVLPAQHPFDRVPDEADHGESNGCDQSKDDAQRGQTGARADIGLSQSGMACRRADNRPEEDGTNHVGTYRESGREFWHGFRTFRNAVRLNERMNRGRLSPAPVRQVPNLSSRSQICHKSGESLSWSEKQLFRCRNMQIVNNFETLLS